MKKRIYITESQVRYIKENSDNVIVGYHCSPEHKGIDEFEKNGIWLTLEEPDTVYGDNIYKYEVNRNEVPIADEDTIFKYMSKDFEVESEIERMGCDEYDIACMPWGFQWFERLKEDGYKAYSFDYDGFTYLYVFNSGDARRVDNDKVINEAKGDNLHQFVEYIGQCGQLGQLSSEVQVNADYIKDNVRQIDNGIFDSQDYYDFMEEHDYTWENEPECKEEFEQLMLDNTVNQILGMLNVNERGLIYVERNIKIPHFSKDSGLIDLFTNKYNGHLGEYWSYFFGQVVDPGCSGNEISFKGWVRPEDVNWTQTVNTNLIFPDEFELYLGWDTSIEIERITAVSSATINNTNSEFTIWNKPIIMLT